jgi:hypothetical protein
MQVIKAPSIEAIKNNITVFLAGSIEMGSAEDWQTRIVEDFKLVDVTFFNPRRDAWDSSWDQKQSNEEFNFQVNWELNRLDHCDIMFMYFSPETKSPISLLELGLIAGRNPEKVVVCCPEGFWRKGNVDITCTRLGVPVYNNLSDAIGALETKISQRAWQK